MIQCVSSIKAFSALFLFWTGRFAFFLADSEAVEKLRNTSLEFTGGEKGSLFTQFQINCFQVINKKILLLF